MGARPKVQGKKRLPLQRYDPRKRRRTKSPEPEKQQEWVEASDDSAMPQDFSGAEEQKAPPRKKVKRTVVEDPKPKKRAKHTRTVVLAGAGDKETRTAAKNNKGKAKLYRVVKGAEDSQ